jgi:hypothetical protein
MIHNVLDDLDRSDGLFAFCRLGPPWLHSGYHLNRPSRGQMPADLSHGSPWVFLVILVIWPWYIHALGWYWLRRASGTMTRTWLPVSPGLGAD